MCNYVIVYIIECSSLDNYINDNNLRTEMIKKLDSLSFKKYFLLVLSN